MSKKGFLDNGDYYIHLQKINIGTLLQNSGNAQINWQQQRNQISIATVAQYKQLLNASLSGPSIEALSLALDLDENELIDRINQTLEQELQNSINTTALKNLHDMINGFGQKSASLSTLIQQSMTQLKNGQWRGNIKAFSEALKVVQSALALLEGDNGELGAAITYAISNSRSFTQIGQRLSAKLNSYQQRNNGKTLKQIALMNACNHLQNLAYVLQNKNFISDKKSKLDPAGLSTLLINNLMATAIAEPLGIAAGVKAGSLLHGTVTQAVGKNQVTVSPQYYGVPSITGKTDLKTDNVDFSIQFMDSAGPYSISMAINLGISSKFYSGQTFGDLSGGNVTVKSGSGGTLKQALDTIFGTGADRYLAYNYMAHNLYTHQLNDLILKRQIIRLFASAGTGDFAQFMLVNGKIVSVWDLVQYVLNNDVGLSASPQGGSGGKTQGVVLHIEGRKNIPAANKREPPDEKDLIAAWKRSKNVNAAINKAKIEATIHFANLAKSLGKSYTI